MIEFVNFDDFFLIKLSMDLIFELKIRLSDNIIKKMSVISIFTKPGLSYRFKCKYFK